MSLTSEKIPPIPSWIAMRMRRKSRSMTVTNSRIVSIPRASPAEMASPDARTTSARD